MRAAAAAAAIVLVMLTFLWMPFTTTAFVSCTTRLASYSKLTCYETTTASKASEIMDLVKNRYGDSIISDDHDIDWQKTQNYVYQASKKLDMEQVNQVLSLLDELFSPLLVASILTSCPRVLRKNVDTQLQPTIHFLQTLYPGKMFIQAISRNPHLVLSSGVEKAVPNEPLDTYLLETVGLTKRNVQSLRTTAPFVFRIDLYKIQQVVEFLQDILKWGDYDSKETKRILTKILATHPALMNLNVTANLQPRVDFLMRTCHLNPRNVATLVKTSSGNVLGLAVDANLRPKIKFLTRLFQREYHKDDAKMVLKKCLLGHAQLLALSLPNIQTKVDYLDAIDDTLACRVAVRAPAVYSLSLKHNVIPKVEFLAKAWGVTSSMVEWHGHDLVLEHPQHVRNDTNSTLASLLIEYPSILTMSLEGNIQPTLTFFNRTGYTYLDENYTLQNDTTARPIRGRYIGASLFNRLLPRWHHVISNEWPLEQQPETGRVDPSSLPPLHLLVGATDQVFCEQLGYGYHEYVAFKDQSMPQLKFSSQFDTWLKTGRPIDVR